jgi:hypothetical protein
VRQWVPTSGLYWLRLGKHQRLTPDRRMGCSAPSIPRNRDPRKNPDTVVKEKLMIQRHRQAHPGLVVGLGDLPAPPLRHLRRGQPRFLSTTLAFSFHGLAGARRGSSIPSRNVSRTRSGHILPISKGFPPETAGYLESSWPQTFPIFSTCPS